MGMGMLKYSPSRGTVFCFDCRLFGQINNHSALTDGLNDWKNADACLCEHEGSGGYKKAMIDFVHHCNADIFSKYTTISQCI